jgi:NadR type nicotinamide-nucleotide adenylyltransferase
MLKKVVVIGPESTGKTTLSRQLATHFNTQWCPEFAREYLLEHGMDYSYDDLLTIAKGQIALEEKHTADLQHQTSSIQHPVSSIQYPASSPYSLLFIDTDMYVMKIWCEFVFGKCHQFILDQIAARKYDLYLLCNIDLPWIKDELREYPDIERRKQLYTIYKQTMMEQPTPSIDISGNYDERFQIAIAAVANMLD